MLVVGLVTYSRLNDANVEDPGLPIGTNRLQHACLELVPDLEPYFVTGRHDDEPGSAQSCSAVFFASSRATTPFAPVGLPHVRKAGARAAGLGSHS